MINRELIRLKTIQVVYSTEVNSDRRPEEVEEELVRSLGTAYDLYNTMLSLMVAISRLALRSFDAQCVRAQRLGEAQPNRKFVDNRFMLQLEGNRQLKENADIQRIDWSNEEEFVRTLLNQVMESDFYSDYMANPQSSYQEDRDLWKHIYRNVISDNENLDNFLEDVNLYWNDDRFVIDTFVIKTINKFQEDTNDFQPLLPEFRSPEDLEFARRLVSQSVRAADYYKNLIGSHTHNWDMERIPLMDRVILQVGLAEITSFPTIPIQVSINEYVEIAKYYSTPNSPRYINVQSHIPHTCATQLCKMCTTTQGLTYIAGQRAYVSTLSTTHTYLHLHLLWVKAHQLYLVYTHLLWFQLVVATLSGQLVGSVASHLTSREQRWSLHYVAHKLWQCLLYQLACNVLCRECLIYLVLQVVAGCCCPQLQCGRILLRVLLQLFNLLCGLTCTQHQHACCQWVQCSRMSHFYSLHVQTLAQHISYVCQRPEARHPVGFIYIYVCAFLKVH